MQGLRAAGFDAVGAEDAAAARRTCSRGAFPSSCLTRAWATEALHSPKLRELTGACIVAPQQISERERRAALEQGADTCLVKPVGLDVLVLSVQDLLRRLQGAMPLATGLTDASGWRIGAHGWDLLLPNGITLQLTHGERLLPEALSASPGRTVSYETILARFSHAKLDSDMQRLGRLVGRLRRKTADLTSERLPLERRARRRLRPAWGSAAASRGRAARR